MKGYSSRAFLSDYTALADWKWWRKLTDTNQYRIIAPELVLIGEVGLGGQIRPVSQMELRLKEAAKLGFKRALVPKGQKRGDVGMEVIEVGRVVDAIATALTNSTQHDPADGSAENSEQ